MRDHKVRHFQVVKNYRTCEIVPDDFVLVFALLKSCIDKKMVARLHYFRSTPKANSTSI